MDRLAEAAAIAEQALEGLPRWALSLLLIVAAAAAGLALHRALFVLATRLARERDLFWRSLVQRMRGPTRLAILLGAVVLAVGAAPLTGDWGDAVGHLVLIGAIVLVAWLLRTALHIWVTLHLRRFRLDTQDNLLARKHVTQFRILQRTAEIAIVVVAVAAVLMTFEGVRQYGVSLLAAGGAAGVVVGLALQPLLKNVFAGIQLALTQPIRIDDALLVEGEWGNVEEITSTYVVLRLWDWRRLILPLSYFLERPFQNWTRHEAELLGSVLLYVDYSAPVAAIRARLEEVVQGSELWDGRVAALQVTDLKERTMELRMLVSAENAGDAFSLRCEVREKIIGWLQETHPDALPRVRAELGGQGDAPSGARAGAGVHPAPQDPT